MNTRELKLGLIQKITQIEDVSLLQKIQAVINTSNSSYNENLKDTPSLDADFNDTEDFTDYIKEWVKNM